MAKDPIGHLATTLAGIAVAVSCISAAFTGWQAWISHHSARQQLRAYVVVSVPRLFQNFGTGLVAHVDSTLDNMGQTPVYDLAWTTGINVADEPMALPEYASCSTIMSAPDARHGYFGKATFPDKDRASPFTDDEIARVKAGRAAVFYNGRICYRDIFKAVHFTDFCIRWRWRNDAFETAAYCEAGNNSDS